MRASEAKIIAREAREKMMNLEAEEFEKSDLGSIVFSEIRTAVGRGKTHVVIAIHGEKQMREIKKVLTYYGYTVACSTDIVDIWWD